MTRTEPSPDPELEALLCEQGLLPLPPGLAARVLASLPAPARPAPWRVLARVAAVVLVSLASWLAFSGRAPALADLGPPAGLTAALPRALPRLPEPFPGTGHGSGDGSSPTWIAAGAMLLAAGTIVARRLLRPAVREEA
jgi:hypothetical protein